VLCLCRGGGCHVGGGGVALGLGYSRPGNGIHACCAAGRATGWSGPASGLWCGGGCPGLDLEKGLAIRSQNPWRPSTSSLRGRCSVFRLLCVREVQNAGCCLLEEVRAVRPGLLEWMKRRKGTGRVSIYSVKTIMNYNPRI
jgi:hypothetical protein